MSVAVVGCALFIVSACSASSGDTGGPQPSGQTTSAPAPSPTPAITLVDKAATCAAYNKMMEEFAEKVLENGKRLLEKSDDATFNEVVTETQKLWTATAAQLEQQAASAKDAEVKAAITGFAAEAKKALAAAEAAGSDATKRRDALNSGELLAAQMKATELCE